MSEKLWYLKRCTLFARLTPTQLQRLEMRSRTRTFPRGSPICLPSQESESVFLLAGGLVKICHLSPDGKESILAFVESGELFGELAILGGDGSGEYIEAIEQSMIVMIPVDELHRLMSEHADVALQITKLIGLRRHRIERRLKNLLFLSNRDRLVHLLLDLAEQFGSQQGDSVRLRPKFSHQDLASLIGSTRETVTLILGQLRAEGSIDYGRCKIVLREPQRLASAVGRQLPVGSRPIQPLTTAFAAG